ncbi:MAG: peptidylprolyl isomerase [Solirubrobacterales bacterium]
MAIAAVGALALAGCGGGGGDKKASKPECKDVAQPAARQSADHKRPTLRLNPRKTYTATVVTSCGTFAVELDVKRAPRTGGSFVTLARHGFYDGLTFHRIAAGFVVQGGDPNGDGSGGPGYSITEKPPGDLAYSQGTVAMAKTGNEPPGTSGSQFFVVTADSDLPPEYALLGTVVKGLDVVQAIEAVGTGAGSDGPPAKPVVIEKVTITET